MEIHIKVHEDSHNSYPSDDLKLILTGCNQTVYLKLSDSDREINITKADLEKALKAL